MFNHHQVAFFSSKKDEINNLEDKVKHYSIQLSIIVTIGRFFE